MSFSINIPNFQCYVRDQFLYNQQRGFSTFTPCNVFGATSIEGRAIGFNILLNNGAQFARLPIHAFVTHEKAQPMKLSELQLWDCLSYEMCAISYGFLQSTRPSCLINKKWHKGKYLFTFDWVGSEWAESPSEHKCGHVIALDNGCIAIQPNNRTRWFNTGFVTELFDQKPGYLVNEHTWQSEIDDTLVSDESDSFFYEIVETNQTSNPVRDMLE